MFGLYDIGASSSYFSNTVQNTSHINHAATEKQVNASASSSSEISTPSLPSYEPQLPTIREGVDPVEFAVRSRIQYAENSDTQNKSAQEVMEEATCQTCEQRKYQDGSDDMGVSYQTPTRIAPEQAASAVRSHEQEHVVREQAKAEREGREVVSQSVTLHTNICPECGDVYISGGTTRTTTRAEQLVQRFEQPEPESSLFQGVA